MGSLPPEESWSNFFLISWPIIPVSIFSSSVAFKDLTLSFENVFFRKQLSMKTSMHYNIQNKHINFQRNRFEGNHNTVLEILPALKL